MVRDAVRVRRPGCRQREALLVRQRSGEVCYRRFGRRREVERAGDFGPLGGAAAGRDSCAERVLVRTLRLAHVGPRIPCEVGRRQYLVKGNGEGAEWRPFAAAQSILELRLRIGALRGVREIEGEVDRSERGCRLVSLPVHKTGRHLKAAVRCHRGVVHGLVAVEVARDEAEIVCCDKVDHRRRDLRRGLLPSGERLPNGVACFGRDKRVPPARCRDAYCVFGSLRVAVVGRGVVFARADSNRRHAPLDCRRLRRNRRERISGRSVDTRTRPAKLVRRIDARRRHLAVRGLSSKRPGIRARLRPAGRHDIPRRAAGDRKLHGIGRHAMDRRRSRHGQRDNRERRGSKRVSVRVRRRNRDGVFRIRRKPGRQRELAGHTRLRISVQPLERMVVRSVEIYGEAGDAGGGKAVEIELDTLGRHLRLSKARERGTFDAEAAGNGHIVVFDDPPTLAVGAGVVGEIARLVEFRRIRRTVCGVVADCGEIRHIVTGQERSAKRLGKPLL